MPKENYQAWEIKLASFPKDGSLESQIEFLLNLAILAPSAHNSQPWQCEIQENKLHIFANSERKLIYGDSSSRQLFLSMGCFLENLVIAADYFGLQYHIEHNPEQIENLILTATFQKSSDIKSHPQHLAPWIMLRHSNRYPYQDRPLPEAILTELKYGAEEDILITFVSEKEKKDALAKVIVEAQVKSMEDANFRQELSGYLKSNFTKDKYGMPGFTVNMPAVVSMFAPKIVKKINLSKLGAKKDLKLFQEQTPTVGLLLIKNDNKTSWLQAGQIFERLWLKATSKGLALSVWAAAIENEDSRSVLKKILGTELNPAVFFRIGFPKNNPPPSPRFNTKEILTNAFKH